MRPLARYGEPGAAPRAALDIETFHARAWAFFHGAVLHRGDARRHAYHNAHTREPPPPTLRKGREKRGGAVVIGDNAVAQGGMAMTEPGVRPRFLGLCSTEHAPELSDRDHRRLRSIMPLPFLKKDVGCAEVYTYVR